MSRGYDRTLDRTEMGDTPREDAAPKPPGRPRNRISSLHQHGRIVRGKVKLRCTHCGREEVADVERMNESRRGRPRCEPCGGIVVAVNQVGKS